jgi:hypothetical protein
MLSKMRWGGVLYSGNDGGWFGQDAHRLPDSSAGFENNAGAA